MSSRFHLKITPPAGALIALLLCCLVFSASARETQPTCVASWCLEQGEFELAVGIGVGVRTNPLYNADNMPLVLVPDFAWYGENWYLDNTEIGYQWVQKPTFAMETFVTLNTTFGDFRRGHFSNFILQGSSITSGIENGAQPGLAPNDNDEGNNGVIFNGKVSPADVQDRDWAIDAGVRLHWYQGNHEWTVSAMHDVSDVYKGAQVGAQYRRFIELGEWQLVGSVGVIWQSSALLDYYYGVDRTDTPDLRLHYTASSGITPRIGLSANREITQNWRWLLHFSYQHLPDALTESPLVDKNYRITTFAGVTYRF